uniref:non-specific serine/threonine protein kinase n=1 Tax=Setaria italica TaxID=4555 RepID=K3ZN92_SETIT
MKLPATGVHFLLVLMVCCTHSLALLEFKKSIIRDPNELLISWNESTHLCSWDGVLCSVRHPHRVISLNLTNRDLVGQISPSLGNLTFLKVLILSASSFSGEIPRSLGQLHHLQILKLNDNMLQGGIPSLANCSKVKELSLGKNQLTGQIPADLPNSLQKLILVANNLTGTVPASLANITVLKIFTCMNNNIEGNIPDEFARLRGLQELHLGKNKLSGRFPQLVLNLSNLVVFSVASNYLSGDVPSDLGGSLPSLKYMSLGGNFFHGHIPSSIANASELNIVDMSRNKLTGVIPSSIGKLQKLFALSFEYNKLQASKEQDWKFMNSLANCTELQVRTVLGNRLQGNVPESLGNLSSQLRYLYLANNHLSGDFPSGIAKLRSLISIELGGNRFTGARLQLDNNILTGPIPSSLCNLSNLIGLYLESNQLDGHIPPSLGNLQTLEILNISNNNLLGTIPKELFGIQTLLNIELSSNNLDGPLHPDIGNAKQLTYLDISSNSLSGEIPSAIGNRERLEDIKLGHNVFSGSVPTSLGNITNLQILNLSRNHLNGSIPVSIVRLKFLEQLDLSFNRLEGEVPTAGIFSNLISVWIDGNTGLCGGQLVRHLRPCSAMHLNSRKNKHFTVQKVVIPLGSIASLAIVKKNVSLPSFGSKFPKVTYIDLARSTEGFSSSKIVVAVKVFCLERKGAQKSFMAECNALRNIRHRNLVPILTACSSDGSSSTLNHITLAQRLSIVVDIADAMEYLHHNHQGTIVHCDLKPSNILLDDNMTARVGDFGLAMFKVDSIMPSFGDSASASSIAIKGTIGYVAPECATGREVTIAGDVYSFGIVLLEIFLRKRPTDDMFKDGLNIVRFVEMNPDRILKIIDPDLLEDERDVSQGTSVSFKEKSLECLASVLKTGLCCANPSPSERMDMQGVAARLHGIKEAYLRGN